MTWAIQSNSCRERNKNEIIEREKNERLGAFAVKYCWTHYLLGVQFFIQKVWKIENFVKNGLINNWIDKRKTDDLSTGKKGVNGSAKRIEERRVEEKKKGESRNGQKEG